VPWGVPLASVCALLGGSGAAHPCPARVVPTTCGASPRHVSPPTALHPGAVSGRLTGPGPFVRGGFCGAAIALSARHDGRGVAWFNPKTIPLMPRWVWGGALAGALPCPPAQFLEGDVWGCGDASLALLWATGVGWLDNLWPMLGGDRVRLLEVGASALFTDASVLPLPVWDAVVYADEELPGVMGAWSHPHQRALDAAVAREAGAGFAAVRWARVFENHFLCGPLVTWAFTGFPIFCSMAPAHGFTRRNPPFSALDERAADVWVSAQVAAGKVVRVPVGGSGAPLPPFVCSPLGAVAKDGGAARRIIHNLSAVEGSVGGSVNDFTHYEAIGALDLLSLEGLMRRMLHLRTARPGVPLFAFKRDLSQCYRQFMTRVRERWPMGFWWRGVFYTHAAVMWGHASAAHVVSLLTCAVCDLMAARGFFVVVYLDDFVSVEASAERSVAASAALTEILCALGLVESVTKAVLTCQQLAVVGVAVDLARFTFGVTDERAMALVQLIDEVLLVAAGGQAVALLVAQRLTSKLNFVAPVISLSRPYLFSLWRWLAPQAEEPRPHFRRVGVEVVAALMWWRRVLVGPAGGRTASLLTGVVAPIRGLVGVSTDASDVGFGIVVASARMFAMGAWEAWEVALLSINCRELYTVAIAALSFGALFRGRVVCVLVDNEVTHFAVCNGGANHPCLRILVWVIAWAQERYVFRLVTRWIPGVTNRLADAASRGVNLALWDPVTGSARSPDGPLWSESPGAVELVRRLFTSGLNPTCTSKQELSERVARQWGIGTLSVETVVCGTSPTLWAPNCGASTAAVDFPLFM